MGIRNFQSSAAINLHPKLELIIVRVQFVHFMNVEMTHGAQSSIMTKNLHNVKAFDNKDASTDCTVAMNLFHKPFME